MGYKTNTGTYVTSQPWTIGPAQSNYILSPWRPAVQARS